MDFPTRKTFYGAGVYSLWPNLDVEISPLWKQLPEFSELIPFLAVRRKLEAFGKIRKGWFIDSSAFSIYTTGAKVTLDDYILFLKDVLSKYGNKIDIYAGLDVIGDPKAGDENQLKMEAAGLKPAATFHRGDSIDFLKAFLDRGYELIAIGGMAIADEYTGAESLFPFLDSVYSEVCDSKGNPRLKTHLFGIGAPKAILRYPCTSYDSTHWLKPGSFGSIMIPRSGPNGMRWLETMLKVQVSIESEERDPNHFKFMRKPEQEMIRSFVESYGFKVEELADVYWQRWLWNLLMAIEVNKKLPDINPFKSTQELSFNFL